MNSRSPVDSCTQDTPGIQTITVRTQTCSQCEGSGNPTGVVEGGVRLQLLGDFGTECVSNGLDNLELVDYDNGHTAAFDGKPDDDGDDDGLGDCKVELSKYCEKNCEISLTSPLEGVRPEPGADGGQRHLDWEGDLDGHRLGPGLRQLLRPPEQQAHLLLRPPAAQPRPGRVLGPHQLPVRPLESRDQH